MKRKKPNLIEQRVALARQGRNPCVVGRLPSGWLVIGDVQHLPGYCLLLADPIVESLNALPEPARIQYCLDVARVGDALLSATGAYRINYETWGNLEPALHTHITPRYMHEPWWKRRMAPGRAYSRLFARRFDAERERALIDTLRLTLSDLIQES